MKYQPFLPTFDTVPLSKVVNVASIPKRSPFRYPGGKTWIIPQIRTWLGHFKSKRKLFIEPFAGGGIVALTAADEGLVDHVIMVELDPDIAAVWKTILEGDARALADRILHFQLTPENVNEVLESGDTSTEHIAFKTILRNRINHGGILAPGAGKVKSGENGKGLKSRWYPETLKKRILDIQQYRERITFIQGDGIQIMHQYAGQSDAAFFIDPPYTAAGKKAGARLYTLFELDHPALFWEAKTLKGDFLMTYEDTQGVIDLAQRFGFEYEKIAMQNTHLTKMHELIISKNLQWLRETR